MVVLSCFDGMAGARIALERAGIKVDKYFASEIDRYAISVSQHNYPDIIQIGDITKVRYEDGMLYTEKGNYFVGKIDLIIGGFPCQAFSKAGLSLNFDDPRGKLFYEFSRVITEINPTHLIAENVVMKKEYQDVISSYLGVFPHKINASLFSAQNRARLYWTNIDVNTTPEDKGIYLSDILEDQVDEKYFLSEKTLEGIKRIVERAKNNNLGYVDTVVDFPYNKKSMTIDANYFKGPDGKRTMVSFSRNGIHNQITKAYPISNTDYKGLNRHQRQTAIIETRGVRKLTPLECERLQQAPDFYTAVPKISDTQRYKMLGNGFPIDVIVFLLKHIKS